MAAVTVAITPGPTRGEAGAGGRAPASSLRPRAESDLWEAWVDRACEVAREELVRRYLPLALRIAHDHCRRSSPRHDDIRAAAFLGLTKAVTRFQPGRGNSFAVYARLVVRGEILRHIRSTRYRVHVPRPHHERWMQLRRARRDAVVELGHEPSIEELAEWLDWDPQLVSDTSAVDAAERPAPIEPLVTTVADASDTAEVAVRHADVGTAIGQLEPRLQQVVVRRYADEAAQSEIAKDLGISQAHVSRLLAKAHQQLREILSYDPEVATSSETDETMAAAPTRMRRAA